MIATLFRKRSSRKRTTLSRKQTTLSTKRTRGLIAPLSTKCSSMMIATLSTKRMLGAVVDQAEEDPQSITPVARIARIATEAQLSLSLKRPSSIDTTVGRVLKKLKPAQLSVPVQQAGGPVEYVILDEPRRSGCLITGEIYLCCARFVQTVHHNRFRILTALPEAKEDLGIITCIPGNEGDEWWLVVIVVADASVIIVDNEPRDPEALAAVQHTCDQVKRIFDIEDVAAVVPRPESLSSIRVIERVGTLARLARTAASPDAAVYGALMLV
ncbi:hypothetical protein PHYPSEUDO_003493 [Phytophthora pseudosyringae]|uniref:Uncharacterized protein n=1 Tax=Phytophthora pseudosyringae TaxID=221518 RepID=A0A8T1VTR4_9STRA|nr:hypothetical protein PHYPSEUDO_003493 [Phytophthora pseudosyringae]